MKTIVVPVDFSDATDLVIQTAAELVKALEGKMILLHVAPPNPAFVGYEAGPLSVTQDIARDFVAEKERLAQLKAALSETPFEIEVRHLEGPTVDTILELVRKEKADLIVIGSHGHTAVYELLVGSVTHGVLRHAKCPVVVVPAGRR